MTDKMIRRLPNDNSKSLLLKGLLLAVAVLSCQAFTPSSLPTSRQEPLTFRHLKTTELPRLSPELLSLQRPNPLTGTNAGALYSSFTDTEQQQDASVRSSTESNSNGDLAYIQDRLDRTDRINKAALTNAFVVGSCVFSALYVLFAEKVEALAALYDYGLGPTDHPDITYMAVSLDLLARMPFDAIKTYEELVPTNPVFFKACTSGVAYALGDFLSQLYQGRTLENIDLPRSARSGAAGFIAHGPLCHYWLLFMENYLDFNGAWWATGIKVTADLTVWSIFLNTAYSTIIGLLAFRSPIEVFKDVRATTWPALRSAWRFWPFVHTVSFSHAVPLDLKLLWVDVMEVVWVTILSKVANEDKNKKLSNDAAAAAAVAPVKSEEREEGEAQVLNYSNSDNNSDDNVVVVESHNTLPDVEIELTREEEMKGAGTPLAFELPQKVLGACWPLIAMWPVLYAGYQVEVALGVVKP